MIGIDKLSEIDKKKLISYIKTLNIRFIPKTYVRHIKSEFHYTFFNYTKKT